MSLLERSVLALDVGEKRVGVAVSDAQGNMAFPLATLQATPREQLFRQINALLHDYDAGEIVLGLPLTMRGEIGPQAQRIQQFAQELEAAVTVPVRFFDERLTTSVAEQHLRDRGMRAEQRRTHVDRIAAAVILQDYLDARRSGKEETNDDAAASDAQS